MGIHLARRMEIEGIDLRFIVPLDEDLIYRSVRKTSRVMIAHEDTVTAGFGAEVAPVVRVAAKDSFVPPAPNLELAVLPSGPDLRRGGDDLNTTDLHSYIHPLGAAVPPCWESKTDWEIFRALAEKLSALSATQFSGPFRDIVATPLCSTVPKTIWPSRA